MTILVWRHAGPSRPAGWVQYAETPEKAAELFVEQFPDAYYYPLHSIFLGRVRHCWRNREESFNRDSWVACMVTLADEGGL
jgi:hypothetical protein